MSNRRDPSSSKTSPAMVSALEAAVPKAPKSWGDKIRALTRADLPDIADHYLRLDPETRRDRFGASLSDTDILGYVQRLPVERGIVAGCFPDSVLRGVIEARPVGGESGHWECVVSIEPDWKRKGLGRTLTESTLANARTSGASRMYLRCSVSNAAGQHFLARFAGQLREEEGDAVAAVDLADPVTATLISTARSRAAGRNPNAANTR